ncbi:MAG: hypothetical protein IT161_18080 [Bryobacterales bacterium]|nr:hypothetical protein [Bryobacterales bacterium]
MVAQVSVRFRGVLYWVLLAGLASAVAQAVPPADGDRDGVADALEQELLARFAPAFFLSSGECDAMPAEFVPGLADPRVMERNGTIYGSVSPVQSPDGAGSFVEVRYHHLWARDCGKAGHDLDAEQVVALVTAPNPDSPAEEWRAVYWYAAAHQGTVCDASHGLRASDARAVDTGPAVWISAGKHASFLNPARCGAGCGADVCIAPSLLRPPQIVNLGEAGAPLNGAVWIHSPRWQAASKLVPHFTSDVVNRLSSSAGSSEVTLYPSLLPAQGLMLATVATGSALDVSSRNTGAALAQASQATGDALSTSAANTSSALNLAGAKTGAALKTSAEKAGQSLKRSAAGAGAFLRLTKPPHPKP